MTSTRQFKVVLLGEARVGKTSISKRWSEGTFDPGTRTTIQAAYFTGSVQLGTEVITINLWDTAGQEKYQALTPIYFKDAQLVIICYSITDPKSFEKTKQWQKVVESSLGPKVPLVIVGNKSDLNSQRSVPTDEGRNYAQSINSPFYEVSAKSGQNISQMFNDIARTLSKLQVFQASGHRRPHVEITDSQPEQSSGGCCSH